MSLTWGERPPGEPILRRLRLSDAPAAYALTQAVGWGHSLADWERLLAWGGRGCFGIEQDGALVATATSTPYGRDRAWIGMVITHPDQRGRGFGRRVTQAVVDHLVGRGVAHILLDASAMGRPLYEKMGFRALYSVEVWAGRASSYLGPRARHLRRDDLPAVVALDAEIFGVPRERLIRRLAQDYPETAWVDDFGGRIDGFLLAHPLGDGQVHLGPWMHRSPWGAEKLLHTALSVLIGQQVRLMIPDRNSQATVFTHRCNLSYQRHCTRMIYGQADPPTEVPSEQYAILSFATG
jgi:GNAT superfamily N-acetyltransferase